MSQNIRHLGEVHPTPIMRIYRAENGFIVTVYLGPGIESKEFVARNEDELADTVRTISRVKPGD